MKFGKSIAISVLLIGLSSQLAHAKKCEDYFWTRWSRETALCVGVPGIGWLSGVLGAPVIEFNGRTYKLLKKADKAFYEGEDSTQEINKYYQSLIEKYPQTTVTKREVIETLHLLNSAEELYYLCKNSERSKMEMPGDFWGLLPYERVFSSREEFESFNEKIRKRQKAHMIRGQS